MSRPRKQTAQATNDARTTNPPGLFDTRAASVLHPALVMCSAIGRAGPAEAGPHVRLGGRRLAVVTLAGICVAVASAAAQTPPPGGGGAAPRGSGGQRGCAPR